MFTRVCLSLVLLGAMPAWSQVDTNATEAGTNTSDQTQMLTPPPVSSEAYTTAVGSTIRSNYLRTGWVINTAYSDNVVGGSGTNPISDVSYSIWPTIAIDKTTTRLHWILNYSPGFTIYQHTSALNQADQNVALDFRYRLSPHVTASARDSLQKTSNVFNQPDSFTGGAISGGVQPQPISVVAPTADQLSNTATMELTYQFSRNGMIGATGAFTNLHYFDPAEVPGLYDSNSGGGSAFYNHRLSRMHYVGATYQYLRFLTYPTTERSETQTHSVLLFYTLYLNPTFSFSVSCGPQHFDVVQSPLPIYRSWSPALTASMGRQGRHMDIAVGYGRTVTSGGGLVGAFLSNSANASAHWQPARAWTLGSTAAYANNKNVTPSSLQSSSGGHTLTGTVSVQHPLGERFNVALGYTRLHQSYSGIPVISNTPNTNLEFISISYQLARPLGR